MGKSNTRVELQYKMADSGKEKYNARAEYGGWTPGCSLHHVDVIIAAVHINHYRIAFSRVCLRLV